MDEALRRLEGRIQELWKGSRKIVGRHEPLIDDVPTRFRRNHGRLLDDAAVTKRLVVRSSLEAEERQLKVALRHFLWPLDQELADRELLRRSGDTKGIPIHGDIAMGRCTQPHVLEVPLQTPTILCCICAVLRPKGCDDCVCIRVTGTEAGCSKYLFPERWINLSRLCRHRPEEDGSENPARCFIKERLSRSRSTTSRE